MGDKNKYNYSKIPPIKMSRRIDKRSFKNGNKIPKKNNKQKRRKKTSDATTSNKWKEKRMDAQQIICAVLKSHFTTSQFVYSL